MGRFLKCSVRLILGSSGLVFLTILALCFTPYPWRAYAWLGQDEHTLKGEPDVLVMLGSGGIPSEADLMRSYILAAAARKHPNAMVAVAITDTNDPAVVRLKDELVLRGIKEERILWEDQGRNTREQALLMHKLLYADEMEPRVVLVTSPTHLRRALLAFRKAGFHDITGLTEYGSSLEADLSYQPEQLGQTGTSPAPTIASVGKLSVLRYEFWNHANYIIGFTQEFTALTYYRMMGWI